MGQGETKNVPNFNSQIHNNHSLLATSTPIQQSNGKTPPRVKNWVMEMQI